MRCFATWLAASWDFRSSCVMPGSRTMLRNVSITSRRIRPRSTIFRPLRLESLLVVSRAFGEKPPGSIAPMSVTWTKFADEARQPALVVDRRDQVDVRRVQRRRVGVVEEVDVVLVDPGILGVGRDDVLDRLGGARQVVQEADAADHQAAVGPVERHHQVVALVRDRRAGDVLQRDDRLVDDRKSRWRMISKVTGSTPSARSPLALSDGRTGPARRGLPCRRRARA